MYDTNPARHPRTASYNLDCLDDPSADDLSVDDISVRRCEVLRLRRNGPNSDILVFGNGGKWC